MNNLKIGKKKIRHGSLQLNSKQQSLNKKDLMINRLDFYFRQKSFPVFLIGSDRERKE